MINNKKLKDNEFVKLLVDTEKIMNNFTKIMNNITDFKMIDELLNCQKDFININKNFNGNKINLYSTIQKKNENYDDKENLFSAHSPNNLKSVLNFKSKKNFEVSSKKSSIFNKFSSQKSKINFDFNENDKNELLNFGEDSVLIKSNLNNKERLNSLKPIVRLLSMNSINEFNFNNNENKENIISLKNENEKEEENSVEYELSDHDSNFSDILRDDNNEEVLNFSKLINIKLFHKSNKNHNNNSVINFFSNPTKFKENIYDSIKKNHKNLNYFCNNKKVPLWVNDLNTFKNNEKNKSKFLDHINKNKLNVNNSNIKDYLNLKSK